LQQRLGLERLPPSHRLGEAAIDGLDGITEPFAIRPHSGFASASSF
jgi:hypothetical protein